MMTKLIYGIGWNDGKYPATKRGKKTASYNIWKNMLERVYYPERRLKDLSYEGCSVSENFRSYSFFHEWCLRQIGFGNEGFQLDKDLLSLGNKLYSEDTCVFIPQEVNKLLTTRKACRGDLPIGVQKEGKYFRSEGSFGTFHKRHLGSFPTAIKAFLRYKQVKEAYIKFKAEQWREFIDPRAYEALIAYEVLITD